MYEVVLGSVSQLLNPLFCLDWAPFVRNVSDGPVLQLIKLVGEKSYEVGNCT